jgi:hypothetical protein
LGLAKGVASCLFPILGSREGGPGRRNSFRISGSVKESPAAMPSADWHSGTSRPGRWQSEHGSSPPCVHIAGGDPSLDAPAVLASGSWAECTPTLLPFLTGFLISRCCTTTSFTCSRRAAISCRPLPYRRPAKHAGASLQPQMPFQQIPGKIQRRYRCRSRNCRGSIESLDRRCQVAALVLPHGKPTRFGTFLFRS